LKENGEFGNYKLKRQEEYMTKLKSFFFAASALTLVIITACSNAAQIPDAGTDGSAALPEASFVEGGASLILSPNKLDIEVKAVTSDGTPVTVEGCTETELTSGTETVLHAKGTVVILKGKIIKLNCHNNQLTALNVQGCTALQMLECYNNQLTAQAFTKLFNDLPKWDSDDAWCILYTEESGVTEGNHTDFTAPPDLADAFNNAKNNKKWKMYKRNGSWPGVEL